jgi:hypothetical protein
LSYLPYLITSVLFVEGGKHYVPETNDKACEIVRKEAQERVFVSCKMLIQTEK